MQKLVVTAWYMESSKQWYVDIDGELPDQATGETIHVHEDGRCDADGSTGYELARDLLTYAHELI